MLLVRRAWRSCSRCRGHTAQPPAGAVRFASSAFLDRVRDIGGGSVELDTTDTHVARVIIDNPSKRNSITGRMMAELADVVRQLELYDGVACTLEGSGEFFCSGADLDLVQHHVGTPEMGYAMASHMHDVLSRFRRLPLVSVALISGGAVGGGAEVATSCDFRLIAEDASFHFKHATIGLSPGWGGGSRLVAMVGRKKALQLLAGAKKLSAAESVAYGIADETFVPGSGGQRAAAKKFLQPYVDAGAVHKEAVRAAKKLCDYSSENCADLAAALAHEQDLFASLWGTDASKRSIAKTVEQISSPHT